MKLPILSFVILLVAPISVFACEGQCIVSITDAFLGNYTVPINNVLNDIVSPMCD